MEKGITYDGFDLQANEYTVTRIDMYSSAPRKLQNERLARRDRSVTVHSEYESKTIEVEGTIMATTELAMETAIDLLKRALNKFERNLDVVHAGETRRYIATPENVAVTRERGGATMAAFSISFFCRNPFGSSTTTETLTNDSDSLSSASISINVEGSYKAQPLITVTILAATGLTGKLISVSNPVNGIDISVTRDWTVADVLTIDCDAQQVFVNTVEVDYEGRFPEWAPGAGTIAYNDTFTTRTRNLIAEYTPRYL